MVEQCAIYSIYYAFDGIGIENAEEFLLEHIFKVNTIDELNQYQKDLFCSIELVEECNCLEEESV
jgi:hypothetical protein